MTCGVQMGENKLDQPNADAFDEVCEAIEDGEQLTLSHIGRVFGQPFWELLIMCMLDSNDAARAIQMSMLRMREAAEQQAKEIVAQEVKEMASAKAPKISIS